MTNETTSNTRTLRAYALDLLRYPRWVIEREVDFTHCRHDARPNAFLAECLECQFGPACRWLDRHRTPDLDDASLDDVVMAIEGACEHLQTKIRQRGANDAATLAWIREARQFLRAQHP